MELNKKSMVCLTLLRKIEIFYFFCNKCHAY